jgi:hypothetical protein
VIPSIHNQEQHQVYTDYTEQDNNTHTKDQTSQYDRIKTRTSKQEEPIHHELLKK